MSPTLSCLWRSLGVWTKENSRLMEWGVRVPGVEVIFTNSAGKTEDGRGFESRLFIEN